MKEIQLTNSQTGKKEVLKTLTPGKLKMYSCGPTVYGFIHIGNLRAALVSDLFYRYFKWAGYDVTFVRNYTDVDDKIINRANEEKTTSEAITKKYIQEVELDYAAAGMLEPTHKTTVTTHMPEIIHMIEDILKNGHAYVVDGEVIFSIETFPSYGKLSRKNIDELQAGARVEVNSKKKNPLDFTLWKPAKPNEPFWDSPWGKGRPGWHIECSAMSHKWLGAQMDVHHGGEDLIFPHHENEIAQSECATKTAPFVKYWLHNAFVTLSQEKMSKSLGNVFLARDFLKTYGGEVARFMLLSAHYRSLLDFGPETLDQALNSLHRIYEAKQKAQELSQKTKAMPDMKSENAWGEFVAQAEQTKSQMASAYANDLNIPEALAAVFTLIRDFNRTVSMPMAQATPSCILGSQALLEVIEKHLAPVLGIGLLKPEKALDDFSNIRRNRAALQGQTRPNEEEIQRLIQERLEARKSKNFARADEIRKDLLARGVAIKDSPQGTTWEFV